VYGLEQILRVGCTDRGRISELGVCIGAEEDYDEASLIDSDMLDFLLQFDK